MLRGDGTLVDIPGPAVPDDVDLRHQFLSHFASGGSKDRLFLRFKPWEVADIFSVATSSVQAGQLDWSSSPMPDSANDFLVAIFTMTPDGNMVMFGEDVVLLWDESEGELVERAAVGQQGFTASTDLRFPLYVSFGNTADVDGPPDGPTGLCHLEFGDDLVEWNCTIVQHDREMPFSRLMRLSPGATVPAVLFRESMGDPWLYHEGQLVRAEIERPEGIAEDAEYSVAVLDADGDGVDELAFLTTLADGPPTLLYYDGNRGFRLNP